MLSIDMIDNLCDKADALIFDMDGTLVDSMPLHFQAWLLVAETFGLALTKDRFYKLGGVPTLQTLEILSEESGIEIDLQKAKILKENTYQSLLHKVTEISPIADIVRKHAGVKPLAIATGASSANAEAVLKKLDLYSYFDAVATSDDVTNHKPAPDVFLHASTLIGVPAIDCLAFEDTDIGIEAIQAAQMQVIDVRNFLLAS